ncbi:hypothetical protein E4T43_05912 [Aureobasidium subglaciale]|nr:hypothetical protein E4T43_05912 [Aureobasidium subglaciale]
MSCPEPMDEAPSPLLPDAKPTGSDLLKQGTDSETHEEIPEEQLAFIARMSNVSALSTIEGETVEELNERYQEAKIAIENSLRNNTLVPEERVIFESLHKQYLAAEAEQNESKQHNTKETGNGNKRRRTSSPSLFVRPDEKPCADAIDLAGASPSSKRKLETEPVQSPTIDKPAKKNETIRQSLDRLVPEAPEHKKQAAIRDRTRVLHAVSQFPPDEIQYLGDGKWTIGGVTTPLRTHQVINVGFMRSREKATSGSRGGILADQMGLGKTVCSLTSMVQGKSLCGPRESTTSLVIVPKSLKNQWIQEALAHAVCAESKEMQGLSVDTAYSTDGGPKSLIQQFKMADLVVATYPELVSGFNLKSHKYPENLSEAEKQTHFDKVIRPTLCALFQLRFRAIFLDERHFIRDVKTMFAQAVQKLDGKHRWVLTGTPMTNSPKDLYSLLAFIRHPEALKFTFKQFEKRHMGEIEDDSKGKSKGRGKGSDKGKSKVKSKSKGNSKDDEKRGVDEKWIAGLLRNCMSRWTYEDELFAQPLIGIPTPKIIDWTQEFSVPERIIYLVVCERLLLLAIDMVNDPSSIDTSQYIKGQLMLLRMMIGHVLTTLTPFTSLTDEDMTKIFTQISIAADPYAQDYIEALKKIHKNAQCVICHKGAQDKQYTRYYHVHCGTCLDEQKRLAVKHNLDGAECVVCKSPIGEVTIKSEVIKEEYEKEKKYQPQEEKLKAEAIEADPEVKEAVLEEEEDGSKKKVEEPRWLNETGNVIPSTKSAASLARRRSAAPQAKAVVFTSFKDSYRFLEATFSQKNWKLTTLTSDMSGAERDASVKRFEEDPEIFIILAMSGVGEVGLNLTVAQYLINYDNYFNESTELQTRGRIYRIGQEKETTMVSLTVAGTVDDRIVEIKRRKITDIQKVIKASNKERAKALLAMFKKSKINDDEGPVWLDDTGIEADAT